MPQKVVMRVFRMETLEKTWDGLKKFCFLHGFRSFWIRGGKLIRLRFFLIVLLFSATVQKPRVSPSVQ